MAKVPPRPLGKGAPPLASQVQGNLDKDETLEMANLNLKVPAPFKIEFKTYAATKSQSMNRIFQEAFKLYRANNP